MLDTQCPGAENAAHALCFAEELLGPYRVVRSQLDDAVEAIGLADRGRAEADLRRTRNVVRRDTHQNFMVSVHTCSRLSSPVTVSPSVPRLFMDHRYRSEAEPRRSQ